MQQRHAAASSSAAPKRVLVLGGNGYVGSHIVQELVSRKRAGQALHIASMSRSGTPPANSAAYASDVEWRRGDLLADPEQSGLAEQMTGYNAVISTVVMLGGRRTMGEVSAQANIHAIQAAKEAKVPRFVYVSAHHYALPEFMKRGYFEGKFKAEEALQTEFGSQGVQIRPSFIFGTRQVRGFSVPLWVVGTPLQKLTTFGPVRSLLNIPLVGPVLAPLLTPPVSVQAVARAAVDAALSEQPSKQIIDVDDLIKYEE